MLTVGKISNTDFLNPNNMLLMEITKTAVGILNVITARSDQLESE